MFRFTASYYDSYHFDISTHISTRLLPLFAGADKRGLSSINMTVKDLATRAKDNKLKPEEFQGGSFSVSNLGAISL